jgi:hypothetical protein
MAIPTALISSAAVFGILYADAINEPLHAQSGPTTQQSMPVTFRSSERRTALLELFTSEGCSSCPPAEAWLSRLKDSSGLWKDFVPIAFHVDYWDHLGWRDEWGSKTFSERQQTYAQSWHSDSVYTPGFVLNGREWRAWPGSKNVPSATSLQVGVLAVTSTDRSQWHIEFFPLRAKPSTSEFHAALLVSDLNSEVKAGENRGRRLVHDFVALELAEGVLSASGKAARGDFTFHGTRKGAEGGLAVAVWLSSPGSLEPVQATGGWLPER